MTDQSSGWQAPDPEPGPAPGMEFAGPGARLVGYIVDIVIIVAGRDPVSRSSVPCWSSRCRSSS